MPTVQYCGVCAWVSEEGQERVSYCPSCDGPAFTRKGSETDLAAFRAQRKKEGEPEDECTRKVIGHLDVLVDTLTDTLGRYEDAVHASDLGGMQSAKKACHDALDEFLDRCRLAFVEDAKTSIITRRR